MATGTCPTCGAPSEALTGHGLQYFITEMKVSELAALFFKELDVVKCQVCGWSLGVRPTVIVGLTKARAAYVVIGSQLEADPEALLSSLRETHRELGLTLQEIQSFDTLRKAVAGDLSLWFPALNDLSKAIAEGNLADHITEHWRTLTPIFFTVARLTAVGLIPGVRYELYKAKTPDPKYSPEEALQQLTLAQLYVWGELCDSWGSDEKHGPSFERDLQRFIDPGIPFPEAVEPLHETFDKLQTDPQISADSRFCMEAILASLYAVLQQPNPRANSWAELFFAHEVACRLGGDKVSPRIRAMLISEERARATVDPHPAWDAVARRLFDHTDPERIRVIEQIAAKAGYPNLVNRVKWEGEELLIPAETPLEALIKRLAVKIDAHTKSTGELFIEDILEKSQSSARWLVKHRRVDDLERLADVMLEWVGSTDIARAEINAWLGSYLKRLRLPKRLLARIGDTPGVWEYNLPVDSRVTLWTERANALRLAGRLEDALSLSEEIERLQTGSSESLDDPTREWLRSTLYITRSNIAILLRETGAPDSALEILKVLLNETPEDKRIDLLRSLAVTYAELGQLDNTVRCYDEALRLATGPRAEEAPGIRASRATILASLGRFEESLRDLKEFNPELSSNPSDLLAEASAWINLMINDVLLPEAAIDRLRQVYENLTAIAKKAEEDADVDSHLGALRTMAHFWEVLDKPETECEQLWEWAYMAALQYEQVPDPVVLLSLAYYAYRQDEAEKAREYLMQVPSALASHLGGVIDLDLAVKGTVQLRYKLDQLTRVVLDRPTNWDDIRLVAELRRDAIGRAQTLRRRPLIETDIAALSKGLTDEVLAQLSPETGCIGVLEWVDDGERIASFLTCITADKVVSSHWLKQPEVDMRDAIKKVRNRLRGWRLDRGDPFDFPGWRMLEKWLVDALSPYLADNDHLVFIEHEEYLGTPWHVAAAPRWTSSYTAGWTALLSLHSLPALGRAATLGVALVPSFGDKAAPKLLGAMRNSAQRTRSLALEYGVDFLIAEEEACDRDAFRTIMNRSDLVKLICHGFVGRDGEVALVFAHNRFLPLATSLVGGEAGRVYRFSWRDCQRLSVAPSVVFSAACSTGFSHVAGLGERLGLFSALRQAGTRALMAPRWNIDAERVLPILDDTLERYMRGGVSLARSLHAACKAAEVEQPRWLAWALTLEGDWQCNNH
jgi:tetratricopeptide (TPR) repeat protein